MRSYIIEYLETLKAKKLSLHALKSSRVALTKLDEFKTLPDCTRKDIIDFFAVDRFKDSTQGLYQTFIKKYFKDEGKEDLETLRKDMNRIVGHYLP